MLSDDRARTNNPSSPNFNRLVRRAPKESEMTKSNQLIINFQQLHLYKYGVEISYKAAEYQLKELAELVRLTSKAEV